MEILNELEKLRLFLKTGVPYIAMLIGILIAVMLLNVENGVKSPYLIPIGMQVSGVAYPEKEPEFEFSNCFGSSGPNSLDVVEGFAGAFALITSAPAYAASHALMATNVWRNPRFLSVRTMRTFAFLFIYFNAYFWLFGSFAIYSIHWETTRDQPLAPMTTLGL